MPSLRIYELGYRVARRLGEMRMHDNSLRAGRGRVGSCSPSPFTKHSSFA